MPDITKCDGYGCPLKETCYRFMVVDSAYRQSYFMEPPIENEQCAYFMPIYD